MNERPRLLFVGPLPEHPAYRGMDRPRFGSADMPEPLLLRGLAIEQLAPDEAVESARALIDELPGVELIALVDVDGPRSPWRNPSRPRARPRGPIPVSLNLAVSSWEWLGFDVGEDLPRAWSAIAHRTEVLASDDVARWERHLNRHGLFDERELAEEFLAVYLRSDDPDMGWNDGRWVDAPDFYSVVPIHRMIVAPPR